MTDFDDLNSLLSEAKTLSAERARYEGAKQRLASQRANPNEKIDLLNTVKKWEEIHEWEPQEYILYFTKQHCRNCGAETADEALPFSRLMLASRHKRLANTSRQARVETMEMSLPAMMVVEGQEVPFCIQCVGE